MVVCGGVAWLGWLCLVAGIYHVCHRVHIGICGSRFHNRLMQYIRCH